MVHCLSRHEAWRLTARIGTEPVKGESLLASDGRNAARHLRMPSGKEMEVGVSNLHNDAVPVVARELAHDAVRLSRSMREAAV